MHTFVNVDFVREAAKKDGHPLKLKKTQVAVAKWVKPEEPTLRIEKDVIYSPYIVKHATGQIGEVEFKSPLSTDGTHGWRVKFPPNDGHGEEREFIHATSVTNEHPLLHYRYNKKYPVDPGEVRTAGGGTKDCRHHQEMERNEEFVYNMDLSRSIEGGSFVTINTHTIADAEEFKEVMNYLKTIKGDFADGVEFKSYSPTVRLEPHQFLLSYFKHKDIAPDINKFCLCAEEEYWYERGGKLLLYRPTFCLSDVEYLGKYFNTKPTSSPTPPKSSTPKKPRPPSRSRPPKGKRALRAMEGAHHAHFKK